MAEVWLWKAAWQWAGQMVGIRVVGVFAPDWVAGPARAAGDSPAHRNCHNNPRTPLLTPGTRPAVVQSTTLSPSADQ